MSLNNSQCQKVSVLICYRKLQNVPRDKNIRRRARESRSGTRAAPSCFQPPRSTPAAGGSCAPRGAVTCAVGFRGAFSGENPLGAPRGHRAEAHLPPEARRFLGLRFRFSAGGFGAPRPRSWRLSAGLRGRGVERLRGVRHGSARPGRSWFREVCVNLRGCPEKRPACSLLCVQKSTGLFAFLPPRLLKKPPGRRSEARLLTFNLQN